jgi:hypothetical protein
MKVHHSLATYHGGADDMNKRCAMWLPTFLQRGIHFFGERTQVLAFNNFVLFDRVHLPYHRKARGVLYQSPLIRAGRPVKPLESFLSILYGFIRFYLRASPEDHRASLDS